MKSNSKIIRNTLYVFLALMFVLTCCVSTLTLCATSTTNYSGVLEDLQTDSNFDANTYIQNGADYSLQVIQIAESVDQRLFVYVYQPSGQVRNLRATSINISNNLNGEIEYHNLKLIYLNSSGVFFKYTVSNYWVMQDRDIRYYDISSIFRDYIAGVDEEPPASNTTSEVSYEVGQLWTATTKDGEVTYTSTSTETITITDKYVGFVRYYNGYKFYDSSCDAHYVAFSTDKNIDTLIEAELYFDTRTYIAPTGITSILDPVYGELVEDNYVKLRYTDIASNSANGLFGHKYTWERIETVENFVSDSNNNLSSEVKQSLINKEWVLRFFETDYSTYMAAGVGFNKGIEITNVSILRLMFETDGQVYDLGVVDNKQSGDLIPDNEEPLPWWVKLIIIIICILLLLIILPFLPAIITFIVTVLKYVFKFLWWLISLPFRLIKKE